jgi:Rad3-related DNA helicase
MDELTKARMNKNKNWYGWKTSITFLQSIGRSNRNKNDWCTTYVLDACFFDLQKQAEFPKWLENRIKII